ncbi:MAG: HlyD family efflux transporter periplasmic adaptor subunit, partial [Bacteroidota bacterium]
QQQVYPQYLEVLGELHNDQQIRLSMEVAGTIEQLYVVEGQMVRKGEPLLALNSKMQAHQSQQLQLEEEKLHLVLNNLYLERTHLQKNQISVHQLYTDGVVPLEEKEQADLDLNLVNNRIKVEEENLKSIAKEKDLAHFQKTRLVLRAPQNGRIEQLLVRQYEGVGAGQSVVHFSPKMARANVQLRLTAKEVAQVRIGQTAEVKVDYTQETSLVGKVASITYHRNAAQGYYQVIVTIESSTASLLYGAMVQTRILTDQSTVGYKIPLDAIEHVQEDWVYVLSLTPDSSLQQVRLNYQEMDDDAVWVSSNQQAQLSLVVDKSHGLKAKDKVQYIQYR